jgi:dipeptidyl aminopeptidase/acylaminoacyl peptidase
LANAPHKYRTKKGVGGFDDCRSLHTIDRDSHQDYNLMRGIMFRRIVAAGSLFVLPLIAQADFLEGVTAKGLMLDRIETPPDSIVQAIGDAGFDYWFGEIVHFAIYSPDSSKIAEERQEKPGGKTIGLWIVDPINGTEEQIVEGNVEGTTWSPSGRYLTFYTWVPVDIHVHVGTRQGYEQHGPWIYDFTTSQTSLLPVPEISEYRWSPVGDFLACASLDSIQWRITIYDAERQKTTVIDKVLFTEPWNFSWSPDGRMITYVIATKADGHIEYSPVESDVFVINRDGTERTQITETPHPEILAKWQPDGRSIMVERFKNAPEPSYGGGETEIVLLKLKTR